MLRYGPGYYRNDEQTANCENTRQILHELGKQCAAFDIIKISAYIPGLTLRGLEPPGPADAGKDLLAQLNTETVMFPTNLFFPEGIPSQQALRDQLLCADLQYTQKSLRESIIRIDNIGTGKAQMCKHTVPAEQAGYATKSLCSELLFSVSTLGDKCVVDMRADPYPQVIFTGADGPVTVVVWDPPGQGQVDTAFSDNMADNRWRKAFDKETIFLLEHEGKRRIPRCAVNLDASNALYLPCGSVYAIWNPGNMVRMGHIQWMPSDRVEIKASVDHCSSLFRALSNLVTTPPFNTRSIPDHVLRLVRTRAKEVDRFSVEEPLMIDEIGIFTQIISSIAAKEVDDSGNFRELHRVIVEAMTMSAAVSDTYSGCLPMFRPDFRA